jgi:hypothetical protein
MERYRIADDVGIHFVTMSVVKWLPVFVSEGAFGIVVDSLNFCHEWKGLRVNGYVLMPTHRRKGLVTRAEYWWLSSASYWLSEGKVVNDVVLSQLEW